MCVAQLNTHLTRCHEQAIIKLIICALMSGNSYEKGAEAFHLLQPLRDQRAGFHYRLSHHVTTPAINAAFSRVCQQNIANGIANSPEGLLIAGMLR